MTIDSLFLDLLYDTTIVSKIDKNNIISNILNNNSASSEIIELLNKSKFQSELSEIIMVISAGLTLRIKYSFKNS